MTKFVVGQIIEADSPGEAVTKLHQRNIALMRVGRNTYLVYASDDLAKPQGFARTSSRSPPSPRRPSRGTATFTDQKGD